MFKLSSRALVGAAVALALTACGSASGGAGGSEQLVISTYGTGTPTYTDTAAVAEAMTKRDDTKTRIITSDTGIGRMTPLMRGTAQFVRAGGEYIDAFEGKGDFATKEWGPQPVRVAWSPTSSASFVVLADSDIVEPADLAGKKVPTYTANASVTDKTDGMLAGGGLTRDDVETVELDYSAQADALEAGRVDVIYISPGPGLSELQAKVDLRWLKLDPADEQLAAGLAEKAPDVWVGEFISDTGETKGSDYGLTFAVPLVTTTETSADTVRSLLDGVHESYDDYKDATPTTHTWGIEEVNVAPKLVPFHDELVAFLEEQGKWTEEAQAEQDRLLEREKQLAEGWDEVSADASEEELAEEWAAWKEANLED